MTAGIPNGIRGLRMARTRAALSRLDREGLGVIGKPYAVAALEEVEQWEADLDRLAAALEQALKCTGHWGDGLTEPAICRECQAIARAALESSDA